MPRSLSKNLHVPLPEALYRRLRTESERTRRPATEIAREAIDQWLEDRNRRTIAESIAQYARQNAGSPLDLDESLEAAALDDLQNLPSYDENPQ